MDTTISADIEITLVCRDCGGDMTVANPRGAAELRCYWCHKAAKKEAKKGVMVR
jgi:tRNA(Ile2) C34 agmatinyltransferase TiaS